MEQPEKEQRGLTLLDIKTKQLQCGKRWSRGGRDSEAHKEAFRGGGHVHYLDCDGCVGVYTCPDLTSCTLSMCTVYCMSIIPH